jgi:hypothetical protein
VKKVLMKGADRWMILIDRIVERFYVGDKEEIIDFLKKI